MKFSPSKNEFDQISNKYDIVAVHAKFTTDSETPLSAYTKLSAKKNLPSSSNPLLEGNK